MRGDGVNLGGDASSAEGERWFDDLDGQVDPLKRDLPVTRDVRHGLVELRHDETTSSAHRLDGGRKDVDLDAKGDVSCPWYRGVEEDEVGLMA